jgi:hypothetical protein
MIPYGLMSLLNILCGILTPSYPAVYMVKSSVMEEAMRRGGVFDGIVGEIVEKDIDTTKMAIFEHQRKSQETQNTATSVPYKPSSEQLQPINTESVTVVKETQPIATQNESKGPGVSEKPIGTSEKDNIAFILFSEVSKLIADKDCFVLQRQGSGQRWFV